MAATMQRFVDRFEETPVVVLACSLRYRAPNPHDGANVYPACQNLLLAARALGYGGVMTMWHALAEDDLRRVTGIPDDVVDRRHHRPRPTGGAPRPGAPPTDR